MGRWSTPRPGRINPKEKNQCPSYRRLSGVLCRYGRVLKIHNYRDMILPTVWSVWNLSTNFDIPARPIYMRKLQCILSITKFIPNISNGLLSHWWCSSSTHSLCLLGFLRICLGAVQDGNNPPWSWHGESYFENRWCRWCQASHCVLLYRERR